MIRDRKVRDKERRCTRRKFMGSGLALAAAGLVGTKQAYASDPDYTLIMVPDTQYLALSCSTAFSAMMTWISNHLTSNLGTTDQGANLTLNVKAVLGVGDCTHTVGAGEFTTATTAYGILDSAGVPWVNPPGNHDYDNGLNNRTTGLGSGYKASGYFSAGNRAAASYGSIPTGGTSAWGGSYDTANYYVKLNIGSRKIIVFSVEYQPRAVVLQWAKGIHDQNHSHECIICTHSFVGVTGAFLTYSGETGNTAVTNDNSSFGLGTAQATSDTDFNSGYGMWNTYLNVWPRLTMVLNGHDFFEGQSAPAYHFALNSLTSTSSRAQTVQALFANYQQWDQPSGNYTGSAAQGSATGQPNNVAPNTGTGYCTLLANATWRIAHLMVLQFRPSAGKVDGYCIATNSGKWEQAYADRATAPDTTPHRLFSADYTGVANNLFPLPGVMG